MEEGAKRILDDGKLSKSLKGLHSKKFVTTTEDGNTQTSKLDGSGVNIAFIDQGFDRNMSEFEGRIIHHMTCRWNEKKVEYEVVDYTGERANQDNFHGNTAADLAAGKKCGIAPKANVYFFEINSDDDYDKRVQAILEYIEANMGELKLDIISHSAGASKDALDIADRIREKNGCEYVNSKICWDNFIPGREIKGETVETVETGFVKSVRKVPGVYKDDNGRLLTNQNAMVIPVEGRTSIQVLKDENGNIIESRKFNGAICGASYAIPQLVGYFALARQMNPTMSFETFVNKAREHAKVNSNEQLFITPIEVIEKMLEEQRGVSVQEQGQEPSQEPNNTPSRENVTQRIGRETIKEQNNTALKIDTEQAINADERALESTKDNAQSI